MNWKKWILGLGFFLALGAATYAANVELNIVAGSGIGVSTSTDGRTVTITNTAQGGGGGGGGLPPGMIDVTAAPYNAVCNGSTNDTSAFVAAFAAAAGTGKTVVVPATAGYDPVTNGTGCVVQAEMLTVNGFSLVGAGPGAVLKIIDSPTSTCGGGLYITDDLSQQSFQRAQVHVKNLEIYWAGTITNCATASGIWLFAGNNITLEDVTVLHSPGVGVDIHPFFPNAWVESLLIKDVRVAWSGGDNYRFWVPANCGFCFITQTTIIGSTSRNPGNYAIEIESQGNINSDKVSVWLWVNGEIDCSFSPAADCVHISVNDGGSGGFDNMEDIQFLKTTIEASAGTSHSGYCIGAVNTSGAITSVDFSGLVYSCGNSGILQTANVNAWTIDACTAGPGNCHQHSP
jgi:hypothetical protein